MSRAEWDVLCGALDGIEGIHGPSWRCQEGALNARVCTADDGSTESVYARFRQVRLSVLAPWPAQWFELTGSRRCGPPEAAENLVLSLSEFRTFPIAAPAVHGPPHGWTLVNLDTPVHIDSGTQWFTATLLGHPIEVQAVPVSYWWEFSDGSAPFRSATPGGPFPDATLTNRFQSAGPATITVTTTWEGYYRLHGRTDWSTVDGTVTTTSATDPFTVHTARARLVAEPLE